MILHMVHADSEHRRMGDNRFPRATQRLGLGAFDIELDKRGHGASQQPVQRLGTNCHRVTSGNRLRDLTADSLPPPKPKKKAKPKKR